MAKTNPEVFELMVDAVNNYAIFLLDPEGNVTSWNAGAALIKQYCREEIVGKHFSTFYTPEDIARGWPQAELDIARDLGRVQDTGWRVRKDGSRFWANVTITALRDAEGRLLGYSKITRDLTGQLRRDEELRQSEERFRLMIEGVEDYAIYMLSPEGIITSWNAGARRIKGYLAGEILGLHFSTFFTDEDIAEGKPWAELALARKLSHAEDEGWRVRKDGSRFWARAVISALYDTEGRLRGYAKVTQDLTTRRHSEALEEAVKQTNAFIAVLAHELRNPLAPLLNAIDLMKRMAPGDPGFPKLREISARQAENMARIVEDLVDANRITRGSLRIDLKRIPLQQVVERAVETATPALAAAEHRLQLDLPAAPVVVQGDELRLVQVLTNLVNNAIRYTPSGGRITIALARQGDVATLSVRDTGHGIEAGMLAAIFGMFVQGGERHLRPHSGLGVGLALARSITELHHGTLVAYSAGAGKGSEFVVTLPVSREAAAPAGEGAAAPATGATLTRVMVVDDNVDAADTMSTVLRDFGCEVRTVYDGAAALSLFESERPEVVLLDLGMPGIDGLEVARRLRGLGTRPSPWIVAVTGWGKADDRARTKAAGFDQHLVKPVGAADLRELFESRLVSRPG